MASLTEIDSLVLLLTAQCNLRCSYCYQNAKKSRRMSWRTLGAAVDLALRSRRPEVELLFMGGEPLLEFPAIQRAVAYARRRCPPDKRLRFAISTNGTLITNEIAAFLAENGFRTQLSFDGIPAAQDLRSKGTFGVLDRLLGRLRRDHPEFFSHRFRVSITLTPPGIGHLARSFDYFLARGVRHVAIAPAMVPDSSLAEERREKLDEQFFKICESSLRHFARKGEVPLQMFRKDAVTKPRRRRDDTMCGVMSGRNPAVDVNGQVLACALFAESFQRYRSPLLMSRLQPLRLGHVADRELPERFSRLAQAARQAAIFDHREKKYSSLGRCRDCRYIEGCSICPVSIFCDPANTDPDRVPDFTCAFNQTLLKYRARFLKATAASAQEKHQGLRASAMARSTHGDGRRV